MSSPLSSFQDETLKLYKDNKWKFRINDSLKCIICKDILVDAVQTDCGCRYCKDCINKYLDNKGKECVGEYGECRTIIKSYIYDRATNKEIIFLKVKCLYNDCIFEDTLKNIKNHLDICEYRVQNCSLCGINYVIKDESSHLANECLMREILCQFCSSHLTFEEYKENHLTFESEHLCVKYEAKCPYKCTKESKVNLREHRKTCKNKPYECPLHCYGCKQLIPKDKMIEHLEKTSYEHTSTIVTNLKKLQKENEDMQEMIRSLAKENEMLKKSLEILKNDARKNSSTIERNQCSGDSSLGIMNKTVFRNGRYIWKIINFSKLKENAMMGKNVTVLSDAFYTSEFGYKMCMKIYPSGDGAGKGTHLSVFFVIMKSEYDDLLVWPFKNKVTVTILDDLSKSTNHSDTFKPDIKSICYQKPEEEYNMASGSPKFISFNDLSNFVKKDTLYIQLCVIP